MRNIVSTMFERPYDTNGSVSPVVGSSPITTPMCRYAVSTVTKVSPTATSCRKGERAWRAMRKPSSPYAAKAIVIAGEPEEAPLLADVAGDEVAVRKRQEAVLLPPLPEADAEQPARADGDERLLELVVHLRRRAARIEERREAQHRVLHLLDLVPEHGDREREQRDEVRDAHAAGEQQHGDQQRVQHRHREVRLERREHVEQRR